MPAETPIAPGQPEPNPEVQTLPTRADLYRAVGNLAAGHPVARLKALHEIRQILRRELDAAFDAAELEQVGVARSIRPKRAPWREIGDALGITGQHAQRKFEDALKETG